MGAAFAAAALFDLCAGGAGVVVGAVACAIKRWLVIAPTATTEKKSLRFFINYTLRSLD
jgi:hypothetical protein